MAFISDRFKETLFRIYGMFTTWIGIIVLVVFLVDIFLKGVRRLNLDFLTGFPSRFPEKAGIFPAEVGTLWIFILTAAFTIPLGVAAAVLLEEFMKKGRFASIVEVNIASLSGVPSVIYGILGLEVFGRWLGWGNTLMAGAATLALLIFPVVVLATREALRSVPRAVREGAYALGATRWQAVWHQVLPASLAGILTGIILALSRAVGETAPLIIIGALTFVSFVPDSPWSEFTVLPIQIFNWTSRPQPAFWITAAAAIVILLAMTLMLNGIAVYLRYRWKKRLKW